MSKKDYIAIAAIIKGQVVTHPGENASELFVRASLNDLANDLGDYFKRENASFDFHRFKIACGLV